MTRWVVALFISLVGFAQLSQATQFEVTKKNKTSQIVDGFLLNRCEAGKVSVNIIPNKLKATDTKTVCKEGDTLKDGMITSLASGDDFVIRFGIYQIRTPDQKLIRDFIRNFDSISAAPKPGDVFAFVVEKTQEGFQLTPFSSNPQAADLEPIKYDK